jgi:hypothetical protein
MAQMVCLNAFYEILERMTEDGSEYSGLVIHNLLCIETDLAPPRSLYLAICKAIRKRLRKFKTHILELMYELIREVGYGKWTNYDKA